MQPTWKAVSCRNTKLVHTLLDVKCFHASFFCFVNFASEAMALNWKVQFLSINWAQHERFDTHARIGDKVDFIFIPVKLQTKFLVKRKYIWFGLTASLTHLNNCCHSKTIRSFFFARHVSWRINSKFIHFFCSNWQFDKCWRQVNTLESQKKIAKVLNHLVALGALFSLYKAVSAIMQAYFSCSGEASVLERIYSLQYRSWFGSLV